MHLITQNLEDKIYVV